MVQWPIIERQLNVGHIHCVEKNIVQIFYWTGFSCITETFFIFLLISFVFIFQIEAKVLMSRFLQTFKFTLVPGQSREYRERVTIRPKDGVICTLTKRHQNITGQSGLNAILSHSTKVKTKLVQVIMQFQVHIVINLHN